jgi:transcription elongation factor/antiterminator RfaH
VNIEKAFADVPCWYAIRTNPQQEERAKCNLLAWGVETFSPRVRDRRRNQFTGASTFISKPLFPRYIFARFQASSLLHKIWYTRGVHSVVGFGDGPSPIDDEIIALIRSQVNDDGFVRIGEEFRHGDKVQIKDGPLKNMVGVFERNLKEADRIRILLTTVSYQGHLSIERDLVEKVA